MGRRRIFLLLALVMWLPMVHPFRFPGLSVTSSVQALHDRIENLPSGANILVSFDFNPGTKAELEPQARAILRHAFKRRLTVLVLGLWPDGWGMTQRIVRDCAATAKLPVKEGRDFILLGSQLGDLNVSLGLGQDIAAVFPRDARGIPLADIPPLRHIRTLKDMHLIVSLGAGEPGPVTWVMFAGDRYRIPMAAGTTSGNVSALQPYVQGGQLLGLVSGMKGAAEYEMLTKEDGSATRGMDSLTLGAFLLIGLVLLANVNDWRKGRS